MESIWNTKCGDLVKTQGIIVIDAETSIENGAEVKSKLWELQRS
jgi:hypothetical protein